MGKKIDRTLQEFAEILKAEGLYVKDDIDVFGKGEKVIQKLTYDSKKVSEDTLFVCKGAAFKAEYLKEAVNSGACAYVSETEYEGIDAPCIIVNDIRSTMCVIGNYFYNKPWEDLNLIGITGTKGKSSTAYYVKAICDDYMEAAGGKESGVSSSIDVYDGVIREESHITTPEALELFEHFDNAKNSGITFFEMEVSSQALKYKRVEGIRYNAGAFTNIGTDHISPVEHADFEDYFSSKLMLFDIVDNACVNLDCDHADEILAAAKAKAPNVITYGTKEGADVYGYNIRKEDTEIYFNVKTDKFDEEFVLTMPGLFNVENALSAIALTYALDVPVEYMISGLKRARVPGRMEFYPSKDGKVYAIVDYAHNRMSFEYLFNSVIKEFPGVPIWAIYGSAGGKAISRRFDLGDVSGKYAQKIYLTEEDPGKEPAINTMRDIASAIEPHGTEYEMIEDRKECILKALHDVKEKTILLILGKGAETREKIGTEYLPYPSDVEIVCDFLKEYDEKNPV